MVLLRKLRLPICAEFHFRPQASKVWFPPLDRTVVFERSFADWRSNGKPTADAGGLCECTCEHSAQ